MIGLEKWYRWGSREGEGGIVLLMMISKSSAPIPTSTIKLRGVKSVNSGVSIPTNGQHSRKKLSIPGWALS